MAHGDTIGFILLLIASAASFVAGYFFAELKRAKR